ncbi:uncharacterized protein BXZ73DRAFT_44524, partial [Epithele typhae]|uniref:uncharacterized protein n=1 Tax=Epithele typhae TaxID=378194 RepID=UPI002008E744
IQRCLSLTPNVEVLAIHLPRPTPPTILSGILLPKLAVFTTSLPHRCIASFLLYNLSITALSIQACGLSLNCPLRRLDLRHITDIHGPARCVTHVADGQVRRATVNLTRLASSVSVAVQALATSPLHCLVIDFFSHDYNILTKVATSVPNVKALRLIEKPGAQDRDHIGPWHHLSEWHQALLRLSNLEEIELQTVNNIKVPSNYSLPKLASVWANGLKPHQTRHPTLFHITVWAAGGRSHWFKHSNGEWGTPL